ncbi:PREDICTED: uncharacterized protein LOC105975419 [Erythranthe guttata]|uniref:uncharacterized protein LOC105975419 n=1 Tax=Erythranthe guttata TaxID=4155 RepID=UPI00064DF010|nr:PREDICTED: uncharacterized protein LOC105975419 [Erythranthe guttata]|eukprot:XP_012856072.1 PREDICTED: uncharacterized protein LOC105975419 [Erythranthe guttata]
MEMNKHKVDPDTQNPRKRMKKGERIIDKLHDDILIAIVSCMSLKDAVRTSVLSSRWRYLWMFSGKLEFDDRDTSTGKIMKRGRERTIASPDLHQLYSLKRLELTVLSMNCRSLLFFTSLIKSSPNLQEFRIKIEYLTYNQLLKRGSTQLFPVVSSVMTAEFQHKNLKVIELSGYVGITSEDEFILHLIKVAPSLDVVFIDTQTDHHAKENYDRFGTSPDWQDCQLRLYAMYRAEGLARTCISQIKFVIT